MEFYPFIRDLTIIIIHCTVPLSLCWLSSGHWEHTWHREGFCAGVGCSRLQHLHHLPRAGRLRAGGQESRYSPPALHLTWHSPSALPPLLTHATLFPFEFALLLSLSFADWRLTEASVLADLSLVPSFLLLNFVFAPFCSCDRVHWGHWSCLLQRACCLRPKCCPYQSKRW